MRSDLGRFILSSLARLVAAIAAAVALALVAAPIWAQGPGVAMPKGSEPKDIGVAFRMSTLGFGVEGGKVINDRFSARVGVNYFGYNFTQPEEDIRYVGKLRLQSLSVIGDYYPSMTHSFHLSLGVLVNNTTVKADGNPDETGHYTINHHNYTKAQVGAFHGDATFPSVSPYVGMGFGRPARRGSAWQLLADVGAMFGKPTLTLNADGESANSALATDMRAEQANAQSNINRWLAVYPVVSFGLSYRF